MDDLVPRVPAAAGVPHPACPHSRPRSRRVSIPGSDAAHKRAGDGVTSFCDPVPGTVLPVRDSLSDRRVLSPGRTLQPAATLVGPLIGGHPHAFARNVAAVTLTRVRARYDAAVAGGARLVRAPAVPGSAISAGAPAAVHHLFFHHLGTRSHAAAALKSS
ncbi:hypothetical protein BGM19_29550 [Streptomyces agglomeratus]|uniref:hypothetical protein n=1 Tax=Streptomyces agglomeratus TaxID=285458 RepID=UPI00086941D2|nr:hypothetical protein BGM19_29550 [Streptomyces agglomeratus]